MSAWMRFGWVSVALTTALAARSEAGPISRGGASFNRTGWSAGRDLSLANQSTALSTWMHPTWSPSLPQTFSRFSGPPGGTLPSQPPPAPAYAPVAPAYVPPAPAYTPPAAISAPLAPVYMPPAASAPPAAPMTAALAAPAPAASTVANAFINLGVGPYPSADSVTNGGAQPWYNSQSPLISNGPGVPPTSQQQADFAAAVMQRVQQTFQLSGVNVTLTDDPNVPAAHTVSLVSNTSALLLPSAIGMTYVGGNGFSFVDQAAQTAQSLDQLEWIVAHNLSHELMLALGVPEKYDGTGSFVDARNAIWSMMTDPSSTFSPAAAAALNQAIAQAASNPDSSPLSAQVIDPKPVPEPTTLLLWSVSTLAVVATRSRTRFAGR